MVNFTFVIIAGIIDISTFRRIIATIIDNLFIKILTGNKSKKINK